LNVLLITADQWRADCLGILANRAPGGLPVRTPTLDAFGRKAVVFARHYSQATPCGPSRAALLTGTYSFNNRSIANGTPLDARHQTVAQIARRHGLRPVLFGYSDTSIDPRTVPAGDPRLLTYEGVAPGFELGCLLTESAEPWLDHLAKRGHGRLSVEEVYDTPLGEPARYAAEYSETAFLTDRFLNFLGSRQAAEPWFAHLSYIKPHPPWVAAAPYHAMYDRTAMPRARRAASLEAEAARHPYLAALLARPFTGWLGQRLRRPADLTDAVVAELRAVYLGLVAELDRQLGRVIGALVASGALERTLVILTADHGEMLGDGWQLGKQGFRPEAFHVPLIIRHPARQRPGVVVEAFTEHVDLMPTILEALGITPPRQCDGHSLLPLLTGEVPAGWRDAAVYEHDFRDLETGWHRKALGLEDDQCGILVRRSAARLHAHFAGLPPLAWALDATSRPTDIDDPALLLEDTSALLRHRMTRADRRLTGCLLTASGVIGGYDPL
jgi:arylsulfatase A-like enzyme